MINEKMKILKMLEEGKINADEAARLLESLGTGASFSPNNNEKSPSSDPYVKPEKPSPSDVYGRNEKQAFSDPFDKNKFEQKDYSSRPGNNGHRNDPPPNYSFDDFANELGRKFESFAKDFEPKLQKFTERVVEKTAEVADKITKSIQTPDPVSAQRHREYAKPMPYGSSKRVEKEIELKVAPGNNELIISCLNAPILLKGYNGDKISAKLLCVPKRNNARIDFSVLGSKYFLDYDEDDFEKVAIDAFIPETLFRNINVSNYNGSLTLSTLNSSLINVYVSNGNVDIDNLYAENLKVECENGKEMRLDNIYCENAQIENYNGNITANRLDIENLKMTSYNGFFNMNVSEFRKYVNYSWILETSNQKLNVNLPTISGVGYYIKAKTSLGSVKVGLTGMNYILNNINMVEAKSIEFDSLPKKVRISMETSNASLVIN